MRESAYLAEALAEAVEAAASLGSLSVDARRLVEVEARIAYLVCGGGRGWVTEGEISDRDALRARVGKRWNVSARRWESLDAADQ